MTRPWCGLAVAIALVACASNPAPTHDVGPTPAHPSPAPRPAVPAPASPTPTPPPLAPPPSSEVGLRVHYNASPNGNHESVRAYLEKAGIFEQLALSLNSLLRFPRMVMIEWRTCGLANAFWEPKSGRIIMCYELVEDLDAMFGRVLRDRAQRRSAIMSAIVFSFLHEFGHGAIATFKIPAVGREEDAVDQLAALFLIAADGKDGGTVAMYGAEFFHLLAQADRRQQYFDEHSLDDQRFYNVLCLVFGSDPQRYMWMVGNAGLPASRARRCPAEYAKLSAAWEALLKDYMRTTLADVTASQRTTNTCEGAAHHVLAILTERWRIEMSNADPTDAARSKTRIDQLVGAITNQCRARRWPQASIACVERALSIPAIEK